MSTNYVEPAMAKALTRETIHKLVDSTMSNRIKFIGDNEQTYTGNPAQLINEIVDRLMDKAINPASSV